MLFGVAIVAGVVAFAAVPETEARWVEKTVQKCAPQRTCRNVQVTEQACTVRQECQQRQQMQQRCHNVPRCQTVTQYMQQCRQIQQCVGRQCYFVPQCVNVPVARQHCVNHQVCQNAMMPVRQCHNVRNCQPRVVSKQQCGVEQVCRTVTERVWDPNLARQDKAAADRVKAEAAKAHLDAQRAAAEAKARAEAASRADAAARAKAQFEAQRAAADAKAKADALARLKADAKANARTEPKTKVAPLYNKAPDIKAGPPPKLQPPSAGHAKLKRPVVLTPAMQAKAEVHRRRIGELKREIARRQQKRAGDRDGSTAEDEHGTNQLLAELFGEEGALRTLLEQGADDAETDTADDDTPPPDPAPKIAGPSPEQAKLAIAKGSDAGVPPPAERAPALTALKKGARTCLPLQADGQPCVAPGKVSAAPKDACGASETGIRVTFTNRCAHAVQIHRYVAPTGPDGKAQSQRTIITLGAVGSRKSYLECGDARTEKLHVAVPAGELANARCRR
jgi:hypothetical protein